uniref:hypothetical protein n=1 Tax=Vibrio harveyi TaxID=669 RepID=UPI000A5F0C70
TFFSELNDRGVKYSVLRWFEELPLVKDGEDIDMLVLDKDFDLCMTYFTPFEIHGGQKFDIYSSEFRDNENFHNMSYYPVELAEYILNNSSIKDNGVFSPNDKAFELSFLYHILFHKAERSGFNENGYDKESRPEHDYFKIINDDLLIKLDSLSGIYSYLNQHDFTPSIDTQKKLAAMNNSSSLMNLISKTELRYDLRGVKGELACLIVREKLLEHENILGELYKLIAHFGLEIVKTVDVSDNEKVINNIRGGNWAKGPWPISGGKPAKAIFVYNHTPKFIKNDDGFDMDSTIIKLKRTLRDFTSSNLFYSSSFNGLHTSDGTIEALEYADFMGKNYTEELLSECKSLDSYLDVCGNHEIVSNLSRFG